MKQKVKRILARFGAEDFVKRIYRSLFPFRPKPWAWPSETSKCRERLAPFCTGYGLDLGFGGDPIVAHAIRVDLPSPYTSVGSMPVQLGGGAENLYWFRDGTLDFIYSSHLLEDYVETEIVLAEWLRVLKPGGKLVLYCPDEQRFREHCRRSGQPYNENHKLAHFSLAHVRQCCARLGDHRCIHEVPFAEIYSWDLVIEKSGAGQE